MRLCLLTLVCILTVTTTLRAQEKKPCLEERRTQVNEIKDKKDLTAGDVQRRLGKPDRVARQILFRRHLEQWIYDDLGVRFEFNCLPGEEPKILNVLQGS